MVNVKGKSGKVVYGLIFFCVCGILSVVIFIILIVFKVFVKDKNKKLMFCDMSL